MSRYRLLVSALAAGVIGSGMASASSASAAASVSGVSTPSALPPTAVFLGAKPRDLPRVSGLAVSFPPLAGAAGSAAAP